MSVSSLADLYFIALGLFSYNILFEVLTDTGIIFVPFITTIVGAIKDALESSKNMSDTASSLKSLETKVYAMTFAYVFCVMPVNPFKMNDVQQYVKQCEALSETTIIEENATDLLQLGKIEVEGNAITAKDMMIDISGEDIRVPVMLNLVMRLATGTSLYAVKRLPCTINMSALSDELMNAHIKDPRLKVETKEFLKQCYAKAKNMGYRNSDTGLPWVADPDTADFPWAGHNAFMNDAYYGNQRIGMYANTILDGYDDYYEEGKKPTCREWWQGKGAGISNAFSLSNNMGLRNRLYNEMDSALKAKIEMFPDMTSGESELDKTIKVYYFNPYNVSDILNAEVKDYGNEAEGVSGWLNDKFSRAVGTVGMASNIIPSFAGASMIQIAAPIAKAVILFVVITILPLTYIVSNLSWKWIVGIHMFVFSIFLWSIFWDLAILAQQSFIEETISDSTFPLWSMMTQPNTMMISKMLTDAMFLAFPLILTSLLTAAGMQGGTGVTNAVGNPGGAAGSPANAGGQRAQAAAKSKASKAVNTAKAAKTAGVSNLKK